MDSQTNPGLARSLEEALVKLRGIRKARVDELDGDFAIEVLAAPERSEQALRGQIVATARATLPVGARVRITVLIAAKKRPPGAEQPRRKLSSLVTRRTHDRFATQVILSRGGDVVTGEAEVPTGPEQARAVAQAVIDGLDEVSPEPLRLETLETVTLGGGVLVLAEVTFGERRLLGTAEVHFDLPDAIARATLKALNRSLSHSA